MTESSSRFVSSRPADLHAERIGTQFRAVNRRLDSMIAQLLDNCSLRAGDSCLDYGCAARPYRRMLPSGVRYIGADLAGNPDADVEIGPDGRLPVADGSVDAVLSTQVLEHVTDPNVYLDEVVRVLRPGGSLVLSTHGIMYYHRDPEDYWRWTHAGLESLLAGRGLAVRESQAVLGLTGVALQLLQDSFAWRLPRRLRPALFAVVQFAIERTDRRETLETRLANPLVLGVRAESSAPDET